LVVDLFTRPDSTPLRLRARPVPRGKDVMDRRHQRELDAYLDGLVQDLHWEPQSGGHLALELSLGLPETTSLIGGGHDLDDYVFPVVGRLGPVRFDAVFATKQHADHSAVRIAPAVTVNPATGNPATGNPAAIDPATDSATSPGFRARITAPATSIEWKQQLHDAVRDVTTAPAPPGAVAVELRLSVSRRRNWTALWKPAIDALGPILGVRDPTRPYLADDDRITDLSLHRRFDDLLGDRVIVELWWRSLAQRAPR
jgi:hypothetical protein